MESQPQHVMHLHAVHPSGEEEWLCPTCGRLILMNWPPAYKKTVLVVGDDEAIHMGGKSPAGLTLRMAEAQVNEPRPETPPQTPTLEATPTPLSDEMTQWLREAGFEEWWDV